MSDSLRPHGLQPTRLLHPWDFPGKSTGVDCHCLLQNHHKTQPTPLLGIYPEETKIEKDTCIPLFISALFAKTTTWKQPRCALTDEWIKKLWYIHTMEYYSDIKRNAFESVLMRWMNLEPIIQSEVSQNEKDKYCILMHIYII